MLKFIIVADLEKMEDEQEVKRIMKVSDAFSLIWDIDQLARNHTKHGADASKIIDEIRATIGESGLMDLYC